MRVLAVCLDEARRNNESRAVQGAQAQNRNGMEESFRSTKILRSLVNGADPQSSIEATPSSHRIELEAESRASGSVGRRWRRRREGKPVPGISRPDHALAVLLVHPEIAVQGVQRVHSPRTRAVN